MNATAQDYMDHLIENLTKDFATTSNFAKVCKEIVDAVYVPDATGGAGYSRKMLNLCLLTGELSRKKQQLELMFCLD